MIALMGLLLVGCLVIPSTAVSILARTFPGLSGHKAAILAALPVPAVVWFFCLKVLYFAATASAEECVVNYCDLAPTIAVIGLVCGMAALAIGTGAALATLQLLRRLRSGRSELD